MATLETAPIITLPLGLIVAVLLGLWLLTVVATRTLAMRGHREQDNDPIQLDRLLSALPWGAMVASATGQVLAINQLAERSFELSRGHFIGSDLMRIVQASIKDSVSVSTHMDSATGKAAWAVEALPVRINSSSEAALVIFSESVQKHGVDMRDRLLGSLSHELRTPLTAIIGHTEILGSTGPDEGAIRERSLQFISSEARRLTRLVEDLLRWTLLQNAPVKLQPINPRLVAEEAISNLYDRAEHHRVQIELRSPPKLPRVLADRDRLQQVFINLLENAVKHSPPKTSVEVTLEHSDDLVNVSIRDHGPGIEAQDLPHLFDPFYRGRLAKEQAGGGTGLGLAIVKSILEQHGTDARVHSTTGDGARFSFDLKIAQTLGE